MVQAVKIIGAGLALAITLASTLLPYIMGISIIGIFMVICMIGIKIKDETDIPGMPGVRCPTCESRGRETWVLPGKHCPVCGTACR